MTHARTRNVRILDWDIERAPSHAPSYGAVYGRTDAHTHARHLDALVREAGHGLADIGVKASNAHLLARNVDVYIGILIARPVAASLVSRSLGVTVAVNGSVGESSG